MPFQDISFEISGVIVKPDDAKNALEKALFQGVREYIKQTVGPIRCKKRYIVYKCNLSP